MDRARVEAILKKHRFSPVEYDDIFEAVEELLEAKADELEISEPYAKEEIDRLRAVAREMNLDDFCTQKDEE